MKKRSSLLLLLVALALFLLMRKRVKHTNDEDGMGHLLEIGKRATVYLNNDWRQVSQSVDATGTRLPWPISISRSTS